MREWLQSAGRVLVRVLVVLVVLVGVAYGVGVWFFSSHFVPGTSINHMLDASWADDETVAARAEELACEWQGQVESDGGFELELTGTDVGLALDGDELVHEARARLNPWLWPYLLVRPQALELDAMVQVDNAALTQVVEPAVAAFNETAAPPTDAQLSFDEAAGAYTIELAQTGDALEAEAVCAEIADAACSFESRVRLSDDALLAAAVADDNETLVAARDAANSLLNHTISLVYDDSEVATLDTATLKSWVIIDEDYQVSLDEDAVWAWVGEVASDAVAHEDDLHVYILDSEAAVQAVLEELGSDSPEATVELTAEVDEDKPPLSEGARSRGRHVDVNLSTQYARLYDGDSNIIWESYIVSGDTSNGHDTPTGSFHLLSKQRNRWLVGADEDKDGEPDYRNFVEYWMLFREGGYGLHDAPWRSYFGGDIYTYAGSHGCINLPPARAAELYDLIRVGDLVYVHF